MGLKVRYYFALSGLLVFFSFSQGVALGYCISPLRGGIKNTKLMQPGPQEPEHHTSLK